VKEVAYKDWHLFFKSKILLLVLCLLLMHIGMVSAQEPGTESWISVNSPDIPQVYPYISGDQVVWTDGVDGSLILYNLLTGRETKLANGYFCEAPAISDNYVVSQIYTVSYDIFLYDMSTGEETILTPFSDDTDDFAPVVAGPYVAWKSFNYSSNTCNVFLYNLSNRSAAAQMISENTGSCGCISGDLNCGNDPTVFPNPSIFEDKVVWDILIEGQYDVNLFNISDGTTVNITGNFPGSDQEYPMISGNYLVWQDDRSGDWDIYVADISNLSNIEVLPLATDPSDQVYPAINNELVVWNDRNNLSLGLFNLSLMTKTQIAPSNRQPKDPSISGNKIVYEGDGVATKIYLFSYDTFVECPVANFINFTSSSGDNAPFDVWFNDTSAPSPDVTLWDFGDGTPVSYEVNPHHTFTSMGVYNVSLTVSTPNCRNKTVRQNFVSVGLPPVADFSGSPVCEVMPASVNFTDRSSGNPTEWAWDFENDGIVDSNLRNPVNVYTMGGNYSVNLTVANMVGIKSLLKEGYVAVMNQSNFVFNTTISGLAVSDNRVTLNTTVMPQYGLTEQTLLLSPSPETGIEEVIMIGDVGGFTFTGDLIEGNVTRVFIHSSQIPLEGLNDTIGGGAYFNFTLELPRYPVNGTIVPYFYEKIIPCDYADFLTIVHGSGFGEITDSAYEIRFLTSNMGIITNMTLNFTVNSSWVAERSKVWIVRLGDDRSGEVLPTNFVGEDLPRQLDVFSAYSPRGSSRFALATLPRTGNPLQIIVLIVQQLFHVGGDTSDGGIPTTTPTQTPTPTTTPAPVPTTPAPAGGIGYLSTDSQGVLSEPIEVIAKDGIGMLSISGGTKALQVDGVRLNNISIRSLDENEVAPLSPGEFFEGIAYELLPEGATFDPALTLTLVVPEGKWSSSKQYSLQWYNRTSNRWEEISTTINAGSHSVSARLGHFSVVGLFSYEIPVTTTTATPIISPPVTTTPMSLLIGLFAVGAAGMVWWVRRRR
jgi:beta propeller repeat protein